MLTKRFLSPSCGVLLLCAVLPGTGRAAALHLDPGPMLGHVSTNEVRLWLRATGPCLPSVRISENEDGAEARTVMGESLTADTDFAATIRITDLQPATRYYYTVLLDGMPAMALPLVAFQTAPPAGTRGHLRVAFVSCTGHFAHEGAAAWGDMAARTNVDLLLMLGDNHYGDTTDINHQRRAYYSHRRLSGFQEIARHTPVYGIWDDHDFAGNDTDGTARGKEDALHVFKQVWANPDFGQRGDAGVYFKFTYGDIDFFMLDGRYHRSPNRAKDDGTKTMLGPAQLAWLKRELLASTARLKFMCSGSEWQNTGHTDSWASFEREREGIFQFIDQQRIGGVLLLSGDRHFTAGYHLHKRFIEVTSGPLGSLPTQVDFLPECFLKHTEGKLYCIYDLDTTGREAVAGLEVYRAGQGLIDSRSFNWDEINGKKPIKLLPLPPAKPERGR